MSDTYYLVCLDCNRGVNLSKPLGVNYGEGLPGTFGFAALGYMDDGVWCPETPGCATLQHFLMLHRLHELRVLPSSIGKFEVLGMNAVPASFPTDEDDSDPDYNLNTFYARDVGFPDGDKEADQLSPDVIRRVTELSTRPR